MMQKYKTAFLGNTVSKTKREKIMQNFNIQPCQFQYDSYLSWYKKIFKWPRVRWFYCFYIYYKKKKKKDQEGGREGGIDPCLQKPHPANKKIISLTTSGCQTGYLYTQGKYTYIFPSTFPSVENFSLWSSGEHLEHCCSLVPSDERAHSLFCLSQSHQGGRTPAETNSGGHDGLIPQGGPISLMSRKKRGAYIKTGAVPAAALYFIWCSAQPCLKTCLSTKTLRFEILEWDQTAA